MLQSLLCLPPNPVHRADLCGITRTSDRGTHIIDPFRESGRRDASLVLVVDDDSSIRTMRVMMLKIRGFKNFVAANGLEALQRHPEAGAALLDLRMPVMDGPEAYREMRKLCRARPVIITSGFAPSKTRTRFGHLAPDAFLQKPFDLEMLTSVLRRTLN